MWAANQGTSHPTSGGGKTLTLHLVAETSTPTPDVMGLAPSLAFEMHLAPLGHTGRMWHAEKIGPNGTVPQRPTDDIHVISSDGA